MQQVISFPVNKIKKAWVRVEILCLDFPKIQSNQNIKSKEVTTFKIWEIFSNLYFSYVRGYKANLYGGNDGWLNLTYVSLAGFWSQLLMKTYEHKNKHTLMLWIGILWVHKKLSKCFWAFTENTTRTQYFSISWKRFSYAISRRKMLFKISS